MNHWLKILILSSGFILTGAPTFADDSDDVEQEESKLSVDDKDLKALSDAKASKSEDGIVRAAARILGVDAKNLTALNTLGTFYFEQGKYGLARIILNRAVQAHPDVAAIHNNLGIILLAENKQRLALAEFRKALEIKSDYRVAAANLGSIFLEYKDYERALSPLEAGYRATRSELKSGSSTAVEVANNYAVALTGIGKYSAAEDIYREIVASTTRSPMVLINFAILLVEKLKNYKEGAKLISKIKFAVDDPKVAKRLEELEEQVSAGDK